MNLNRVYGWASIFALVLLTTACNFTASEPIVITATFDPYSYTPPPADVFATSAPNAISETSPALLPDTTERTYTVQPGDTLSGIALQFGVSVDSLQSLNQIANPDLVSVGQVLQLPDNPTTETPSTQLIPDSRLVRGPGSPAFDTAAFINQQPGYITAATDDVGDQVLSSAQIVRRVSLEYSVDARLLLALLELKGQWLSNPNPTDDVKRYPLGAPASDLGFDRNGLYRQLSWAADRLNAGYYGWLENSVSIIGFDDGTRFRISSTLNAGTVGLQYMLSQYSDAATWNRRVGQGEFLSLYTRYFGDPFAQSVNPVVPANITQPILTLPFPSGEVWRFTGGPHGGWGDGSAWSAIDFAPPDERPADSPSCFVSDYFATASADGVIARIDEGTVILDLDGDGDESTGWTLLYLHIAAQDRVELGAHIRVGDHIGRPSCEGGFSTGTHLHIARRYNGEWIPASCDACDRPVFVLGGWTVVGLPNQLYQGFLVRDGEQRIAEQGRLITENQISW
ncbi:MAG: LysM peptidoglycan-binding domain-containing protein [Anaerolineae bacterium]